MGTVTGVGALACWQHPARVCCSPMRASPLGRCRLQPCATPAGTERCGANAGVIAIGESPIRRGRTALYDPIVYSSCSSEAWRSSSSATCLCPKVQCGVRPARVTDPCRRPSSYPAAADLRRRPQTTRLMDRAWMQPALRQASFRVLRPEVEARATRRYDAERSRVFSHSAMSGTSTSPAAAASISSSASSTV